MFKKFLVFMAVVGIGTGTVPRINCYEFLGLKTEFTSGAKTSGHGQFCYTATAGDWILTDEASDDCSNQTTKAARQFLRGATREVGLNFTDAEITVECCGGNLCNKPTATAKADGNECYEYSGKKSNMKQIGKKCKDGSQCVIATAKQNIATGCVQECSAIIKKIWKSRILSFFTFDKIDEKDTNVECCTGAMCNNATRYTQGEDGTNGVVDGNVVQTGSTTSAPTAGVDGKSLFSLLPLTLGVWSIV